MLSPETRVLLAAFRRPSEGSDAELAAILRSEVNWPRLASLANREGMVSLLSGRLSKHAGAVPAHILGLFRRQAAIVEFQTAVKEQVLGEVVRRLAGHSIRVMLLKGAALATTVYSAFRTRPMADLDVLVESGKAERAWEILREAGWRHQLEAGESFYRNHQHLPGLVDPGGLGVVIELHQFLLPPSGPFRLDEREVWRTSRLIPIGGAEAAVPSADYLLLHSCIHYAWMHLFQSGLCRTTRDIVALVSSVEMDWTGFARLANQARAGTCAYWSLAVAQDLAEAPVPREVLDALKPHPFRALRAVLRRYVVASGLLELCPSIKLDRLLWTLAVRPRRSGHGERRPWHRDHLFLEAFGSPPNAWVRGRGLRDWFRFAQALRTT